MTSWREEYLQNLHDRDVREKSSYQRLDDDLIAAFTNLLDRTAALEAERAASTSTLPPTDTKPRDPSTTEPLSEGTAQLRSELAEALRSNGQLQSRLKRAEAEVVKLRAKNKFDAKLIEDLSKDRIAFRLRAKDKEAEAKGKTKLLEDVHDEVVSLNIQLNMSEQKAKKLKNENEDLIARWMAQKKQEVDEMNKTLHD